MATESPIRMLESDESAKWLPTMDSALYSSPFSDPAGKSSALEEQTRMVPNRSGSAPPTVEGSIAAFRAFMDHRNPNFTSSSDDFLDCESEEQMRTDPAYIAYYYANVKMNPRLPPPLISRENRHFMRYMGGLGGKKVSATEGLLSTHKEEPEEAKSLYKTSGDQNESFVIGMKMTSLAGHNKSSVDVMEGDFVRAPSTAFSTVLNGENDHDVRAVLTTDQNIKSQDSCSLSVDALTCHSSNSLSISTTYSCSRNVESEDNASIRSNVGSDISVVESRMKLLEVSGELMREDDQSRHDSLPPLNNEDRFLPHPSQDATYQLHGIQGYDIPRGTYAIRQKLLPVHQQSLIPNPGFVPPLYASAVAYMNSGNLIYPNLPSPGFPSAQFGLSGYSVNPIYRPHLGGYLRNNAFPQPIDAYSEGNFLKKPMGALSGEMTPYTSQVLRPPFGVPLQGQYLQPLFEESQRNAAQCQLDALASQKDSNVSSLTGSKGHNLPTINNTSVSSTNGAHINITYYGYPPRLGEPHFVSPSTALPGFTISRNIHQGLENEPSASQNSPKSTTFSVLKGQRGPESSDNSKRHSFLELLKSCSSRTLGLSDISGQIVEFSIDQHGSRFIQQKLDNCDSDEKESVFNEVLPQASKLMTDVFGNYVVQKFFEHGTTEQRRKLGQQLSGQVLTLSLQMYGCRVIQKALEVIELDQKVELVKELDGHVPRCVHDQNGNHVIQKCIESIPTEKIKFIISSFTGQVATLSCHPYGCRVIQRVLEHCSDELISQWVVDEILESTSILAKDPYGNYVTQHIMEMGKPNQRSQIITKLVGQFVQLSQHKFASNVVEKCINFGNASEQDLIIEEIVLQSDNNEAPLIMMKDQYANYVVQKVFEIGSEKQKDTLCSCIRLHLPALKNVTYAKHIVSRYEQLEEGSETGADQTLAQR